LIAQVQAAKLSLMESPALAVGSGLSAHRPARYCNSYTHGCPCRHDGDPTRACTRRESAVSRSRKRLGGPSLDPTAVHGEAPRAQLTRSLVGATIPAWQHSTTG
jgi:hypothetical protein